ncbi:MAG: tRNA1(Val) (adenine(37)-N6)-methyltransferase [Candidatus Puniceispirillaceae bacterium]
MGYDPTSKKHSQRQDDADSGSLEDVVITRDYILDGAVAIAQPKSGFRFGTDAVFLAASVGVNRGRILDLGAGVGGVSLCLATRLNKVQITAVELDPVLVALAQKNVVTNGFEDRLRVLPGDIQALPSVLGSSFDHVISNPPYHFATGTKPQNRRRALAHMGDGLTLEDWVKAAMWAVKPRGRITFICRADRGGELVNLFVNAGASETLQFPLWPRPMVPAGRVIIQVRKSVMGPGAILPGLVVHKDDGSFTDAASRIMKGDGLYMAHPAHKARSLPAKSD